MISRACTPGYTAGTNGSNEAAMTDPKPSNTKGRIVLVILAALALTFIVASITSNLNVWRQNDAIEAQEQQAAE